MSRSLGTLSIDLIARTAGFTQGMDKAGRESAKWRKQVEKDMRQAGKYAKTGLKTVAASALAAAAALTVMTKQGMALIDSQAKLARSLDTSFDSITALQLAAGDAGLDGLEGSLTRLNRRLGAAEVGSGAAARAVKALNLDLQALSKMDAAERVATIADAIRDSGASSQRAARHLQDLGFEQREAVQFFAQGGDAIRAYTERVEALGLSLSDIDTAKVEAAGDAMGVFGDITRGVSQQLAVALSPILQQVATDFENAALEAGGLGNKVQEGVDTAVKAVAFLADAADGVKRVFTLAADAIILVLNEIAATAALVAYKTVEAMNAIPGVDMSSTLDSLREFGTTANGVVKEAAANMQRTLEEPLAGAKLLDYYEKAKVAAQDAAEESVRLGKTIGFAGDIAEEAGKKTSASADKAAESIAREITALERAAKTWGMGAGEVKIYDLRLQGASETQLEYAKSLIDTVDNLEAVKKAQEDYAKLQVALDNAQGAADPLFKIEKEHGARLDSLKELLDNQRITEDEYREYTLDAEQQHHQELMALQEERFKAQSIGNELLINSLDSIQQHASTAFIDMATGAKSATEVMYALAGAIGQSVVRALVDMGVQMAINAVKEKIFASTAAATATTLAVTSGAAITAAYTPAAVAASIATMGAAPVAATSSMAAAVPAMTATIASSRLAGMAHDGLDSVPETGTWLLEKGERVTTAETSAKLDATLDRLSGKGAGGNITIHAPITIEAAEGMSNQEARKQGEIMGDALTQRIKSVMGQEMAAGGMLWQG